MNFLLYNYQEDFLTPGNIPSFANSLKQMRQRPKSLMKALPLPQEKQRFFFLVLNFGVFLLLAITDVFAMLIFYFGVFKAISKKGRAL